MLQNKTQIMTNFTSAARICIDVYNEGEMQGRLYHAYREEPLTFHNVIELLKLLGYLFDSYDFPQVSMKPRSFKVQEEPDKNLFTEEVVISKPSQISMDMIRGKQATFWVKVLFRQHATWQGSIKWVEEGNEINFRSALELIMLLDSCFCETKTVSSVKNSKKEKVI
jgi:hypothetical protein